MQSDAHGNRDHASYTGIKCSHLLKCQESRDPDFTGSFIKSRNLGIYPTLYQVDPVEKMYVKSSNVII